jgi:hypothetical protein
MAATDLSSLTRGDKGLRTKRVALPSSAGNVREVILPTWARKFAVFFRTSAGADAEGAWATSGTDDAAQSTDAMPCPAGSSWGDLVLSPGGGSIFLSGTASGYAHLVLSRG